MKTHFLGNIFESPRKVDGTVNAGGLVYFYKPGTSTLKDTYTDYTLDVANPNPVVLDAYGRAQIVLNGAYKVIVRTSDGVLISEADYFNDSGNLTDSDRSNKVVNGDFEETTVTSTLPDNWTITLYTGGTGVIDATTRHSGVNSLKFTSAGSGGGYATTDNFFSVVPENPVTVNFSLKSSAADVRNVVEVLWYTSAQVLDSTTSVYDNSTTNPTAWTARTFSATAPATAYYAKLRLTGCHSSDATVGSTWFDSVSVVPAQRLRLGHTGTTIASAAVVDLSAATGNSLTISGTTGITSFGTVTAGTVFVLTFSGSLTITHNATSLICPNNQNIVTQAGDQVVLESLGSGNWRVVLVKPQLVSAFRAYQSTLQSVSAGSFQRALFQTEEYDNLSEYDTSASRFTAKQSGMYIFSAHVHFASGADGERHAIELWKNGTKFARGMDDTLGAATDDSGSINTIAKLAAGDIVDVYIYSSNARDTITGSGVTYFTGVRLG